MFLNINYNKFIRFLPVFSARFDVLGVGFDAYNIEGRKAGYRVSGIVKQETSPSRGAGYGVRKTKKDLQRKITNFFDERQQAARTNRKDAPCGRLAL